MDVFGENIDREFIETLTPETALSWLEAQPLSHTTRCLNSICVYAPAHVVAAVLDNTDDPPLATLLLGIAHGSFDVVCILTKHIGIPMEPCADNSAISEWLGDRAYLEPVAPNAWNSLTDMQNTAIVSAIRNGNYGFLRSILAELEQHVNNTRLLFDALFGDPTCYTMDLCRSLLNGLTRTIVENTHDDRTVVYQPLRFYLRQAKTRGHTSTIHYILKHPVYKLCSEMAVDSGVYARQMQAILGSPILM